jgi:hypothetical protein
MRGLETLPPDQRAVLQLILRQGRGYADLAGLLKIDVAAVRDRALAGIEALGGPEGAALAAEERARIADYLLGQQDDAQRIVTLAELESSAAASSWARALHERIAPLASGPLPAVPAAPSANGTPPAPTAALPTPEPAPAPAASPPPPPPAAPPRPSAGRPGPRPSRLGGAILLASVAALAVLLVVLLSSGGGNGNGAKTGAAATTSKPATNPRTQPSTTGTTPAAQPTLVAQANLKPTPAGGKAIGVAIAARSAGKLTLALEAQHLPANGAQDFYGIWLQGPPGAKFLGFAPQQVQADGALTVSAPLPANLRSYTTVLLAHQPTRIARPTQPGLAVLSGSLKLVP